MDHNGSVKLIVSFQSSAARSMKLGRLLGHCGPESLAATSRKFVGTAEPGYHMVMHRQRSDQVNHLQKQQSRLNHEWVLAPDWCVPSCPRRAASAGPSTEVWICIFGSSFEDEYQATSPTCFAHDLRDNRMFSNESESKWQHSDARVSNEGIRPSMSHGLVKADEAFWPTHFLPFKFFSSGHLGQAYRKRNQSEADQKRCYLKTKSTWNMCIAWWKSVWKQCHSLVSMRELIHAVKLILGHIDAWLKVDFGVYGRFFLASFVKTKRHAALVCFASLCSRS